MKTLIAVLSVMLLLLVSCAAKPAMKGPEPAQPVPSVQPPSMPATEQTTAAQDVESLEQDLGELDQLEQELADLDSI